MIVASDQGRPSSVSLVAICRPRIFERGASTSVICRHKSIQTQKSTRKYMQVQQFFCHIKFSCPTFSNPASSVQTSALASNHRARIEELPLRARGLLSSVHVACCTSLFEYYECLRLSIFSSPSCNADHRQEKSGSLFGRYGRLNAFVFLSGVCLNGWMMFPSHIHSFTCA